MPSFIINDRRGRLPLYGCRKQHQNSSSRLPLPRPMIKRIGGIDFHTGAANNYNVLS
jgi:hypothetical protein